MRVRRGNYAVIGANFGDEGKGLVTDYLAWKTRADYVVRFNGGAQAGHTVVTPAGRRHIFHHVGAGAFLGIPTYLGPEFIHNPLLFRRELSVLLPSSVKGKIFAHPDAKVTTPWDMLVNQIFESARGGKKHGSCGLGIGETVVAHMAEHMGGRGIVLRELYNYEDNLKEKLFGLLEFSIKRLHSYLPCYLSQSEIDELNDNALFPSSLSAVKERYKLLTNSKSAAKIANQWLEDVKCFTNYVEEADLDTLRHKTLIFEGAQGLGLDQGLWSPTNPYVTRSSTGLTNVLAICKSIDAPDLIPVYVSRSYLTRHGAGPMVTEGMHSSAGYDIPKDLTNITNEYQGELRLGIIDDEISTRTTEDFSKLPHHLISEAMVAITCCDHLPENARYDVAGVASSLARSIFPRHEGTSLLYSIGPTRHHVQYKLRDKL